MFQQIKRQLFPKGIKRSSSLYKNRIFYRVSPQMLEKDFTAIGLVKNDTVCVHSSLNGMGYLKHGSQSVLSALRCILGSSGTIVMPTFTGGGSTYAYVTSNPPPFNKHHTRSSTGQLCEAFRQSPGVERSLHPTHSVAAQGPNAKEWVDGHENSITPFGDHTPYDRLISEKGKVLLLNVNANSLMHRVMEIIDWPNHYLDDLYPLTIMDESDIKTVKTAVHFPGPFSHVVLPGKGKNEIRFVHIPSYAIPFFPGKSEDSFFQQFRPDVAGFLNERNQQLLDEGIIRKGKIGYGQAVLLDAGKFTKRLQEDMRRHLELNPDLYDRERIKRMKETGITQGAMPVL